MTLTFWLLMAGAAAFLVSVWYLVALLADCAHLPPTSFRFGVTAEDDDTRKRLERK